MVKKMYLDVEIFDIDLINGIIYVKSDDVPAIESITGMYLYDKENELISMNDLKIGDMIQIYYNERFPGYNPENIYVEIIRLV